MSVQWELVIPQGNSLMNQIISQNIENPMDVTIFPKDMSNTTSPYLQINVRWTITYHNKE